jgi:hypothetical protein
MQVVVRHYSSNNDGACRLSFLSKPLPSQSLLAQGRLWPIKAGEKKRTGRENGGGRRRDRKEGGDSIEEKEGRRRRRQSEQNKRESEEQ